ncbi:MAG: hypothetical protein KDH88_19975, partial [Chromatiales bacterium]|nr:hypothetical protein [Chromatiales bacterium]
MKVLYSLSGIAAKKSVSSHPSKRHKNGGFEENSAEEEKIGEGGKISAGATPIQPTDQRPTFSP